MIGAKEINALVVFEQNEALLVEKAREFKGLRIQGLDDREGLARVHDARMLLRTYRVSIEKDRVALKANALEFGRRVDAEAKRLTAITEPVERELEAEERRIEAEKERIKAEAAAAKKKVLDDRMAALAAVGVHLAPSVVECMGAIEYGEALNQGRLAFEEREAARIETERQAAELRERERLDAERRAREESERLAQERRAQEEKRAADERALAEERKRLADERARLDAERAAIEAAKPKPAPEPVAAPSARAPKHCPTCTCGGVS